jgi:hypothetical protein
MKNLIKIITILLFSFNMTCAPPEMLILENLAQLHDYQIPVRSIVKINTARTPDHLKIYKVYYRRSNQ